MFADLAGKNVLVTGASSGIGAAAAVAFARNGATVALHFNGNSQAETLARQIRDEGGAAVASQSMIDGGRSGAIINVSSIAARSGGGSGTTLYSATKGFISTATRGWAKELAKHGIRVNAVSPGVIATPLHDRHTPEKAMEAMRASIPMQRVGTPDECAGTFLYLASAQASGYVTGQVIEVNGGMR
ncbi:MAG: oxidoreductase [Rhodobacteraceae bacterium]|nr:oxidoreductase [Paracoccaceae bacterium]